MASVKSPIYVCGATASGKTGYALKLAKEFDGEIVNGDAFQLFRGIEVISAAPSETEKNQVPHHLFGILPLDESCDAGKYANLAKPVIEDIQQRGKKPIIVGGSGLYLKFLTHGPSPLPRGNDALREQLAQYSLEEMLEQLAQLDPIEAEQVDRENPRYVSRSLEICLLSGEPVSALRDRWVARTAEIEEKLDGVWLMRKRDELHHRIAQRTTVMLAQGAIDEVRETLKKKGSWEKAIGLREIRQYLAGEISRERCEELIVYATRQYAKRQETWFRREKWLTQIHL